MKVSIQSNQDEYDNDEETEDEYEENEIQKEANKNNANKFDKKLSYHFLRTAPTFRCRKGKGKTVLVHVGTNKIRGWISDINDKKMLIRYKVNSSSSETMKTVEKWFSKTSKKVELFTRY